MIIKDAIPVKSLPMTMETVSFLYPTIDEQVEDRQVLTSIIKVFSAVPELFSENYSFYIEQTALEKFLHHVNKIYKECGHEATGLFVGYYLHFPEDEIKKVAIATNFLPSFGNSTVVTCEISYEDAARNAEYCLKHKVLALAQGHTHPFRGHIPRFSSTDIATAKSNYAAPHQMSFDSNNLSNEYAGYKMIDGELCNESLYSIDLKKSLATGEFNSKCLYKAILKTRKKQNKPAMEHETETDSIPKETEISAPETNEVNVSSEICPAQFNKARKLIYIILAIQIIQLALILIPYIMFYRIVKLLSTGCFFTLM